MGQEGTTATKAQKRIERLWRKGKLADALDLQGKLCDEFPDDPVHWETLSRLAGEAGNSRVAVAASFRAMRLSRAGADAWMTLADSAAGAGLDEDAIEARFRAADAFAIAGQFTRSLEVLDDVLAKQPDHSHARRIRRLVAARVGRRDEEVASAPAAPAPAPELVEEHDEESEIEHATAVHPSSHPVVLTASEVLVLAQASANLAELLSRALDRGTAGEVSGELREELARLQDAVAVIASLGVG